MKVIELTRSAFTEVMSIPETVENIQAKFSIPVFRQQIKHPKRPMQKGEYYA